MKASRSLDVGGRNLEGVGLIFGNPAEAGLAWTQYAIRWIEGFWGGEAKEIPRPKEILLLKPRFTITHDITHIALDFFLTFHFSHNKLPIV